MACAQVYNDWLAESFLHRPDVFIPAAVVPVRDVASAAAETRTGRRARLQGRDDPDLAARRACRTTGPSSTRCGRSRPTARMPLSLHTGTGALPQHERGPGGAVINYAKVGLLSAETLCYFSRVGCARTVSRICGSCSSRRAPGWFAYCCERMDEAFEEHEQWVKPEARSAAESLREDAVPRDARRRPRAVADARDHRHRSAVVGERLSASRRHVPAQSQDVVERIFAGVPEAEMHAIVGGNAARLYDVAVPA